MAAPQLHRVSIPDAADSCSTARIASGRWDEQQFDDEAELSLPPRLFASERANAKRAEVSSDVFTVRPLHELHEGLIEKKQPTKLSGPLVYRGLARW